MGYAMKNHQMAPAIGKGLPVWVILIAIAWLGCEDKVAKYVDDLKGASVQARIAAADSLGRLKSKRAVEPLIEALGDKYSQVQQAAEDALVAIGASSVKPLMLAASAPRTDVRTRVASALGRIGDSRGIEPLVIQLQDPSTDVQKAAIDALGNVGDYRAAEPLITVLQSGDQQIQDLAMQALVRIDSVAVMPVINAFQIPESKCRNKMADILGRIGDRRAVEPLIKALHDGDRDVRWRSVEALGRLKDSRAVEPLLVELREETGWLSKDIAWSLGEIGDKRALEPLIAIVNDRNNEVRRRAVEALGKIDDQRAIPVLVSTLSDWSLSGSAAEALTKLGWEPRSVEDKIHLWVAKKDKKNLVRSWDQTRQVLINDIKSDVPWVIENALCAFVALGRTGTSQDLANLLYASGTRNMAQGYVNSGMETLSVLAMDWAHKKGYKVWKTGEAAPVRWGEW